MTDATAIMATPDRRTLAVATLHSIANSFAHGYDAPMPQYALFSKHDIPTTQFLQLADYYDAVIHFGDTARWISVPLAADALHGIDAMFNMYVSHGGDDAPLLAHNANLDPCSGGRCTNPEAHAEGGHDR